MTESTYARLTNLSVWFADAHRPFLVRAGRVARSMKCPARCREATSEKERGRDGRVQLEGRRDVVHVTATSFSKLPRWRAYVYKAGLSPSHCCVPLLSPSHLLRSRCRSVLGYRLSRLDVFNVRRGSRRAQIFDTSVAPCASLRSSENG